MASFPSRCSEGIAGYRYEFEGGIAIVIRGDEKRLFIINRKL